MSDAGIPAGGALLRFATAVQTNSDDLLDARIQLLGAVGEAGLVEAAATIAIFNGLVRVADGTGIQLDDGVLADSADYRERLGLNGYGGALNSPIVETHDRAQTVIEMFSTKLS
jgi:hypothetical protein